MKLIRLNTLSGDTIKTRINASDHEIITMYQGLAHSMYEGHRDPFVSVDIFDGDTTATKFTRHHFEQCKQKGA